MPLIKVKPSNEQKNEDAPAGQKLALNANDFFGLESIL